LVSVAIALGRLCVLWTRNDSPAWNCGLTLDVEGNRLFASGLPFPADVQQGHSPQMSTDSPSRARPGIVSPEIAQISLHNPRPLSLRIYTLLAVLYPALYYAYYHDYDTYIKSEEWTFVYCVGLGLIHALSFLITRWSKAAAAKLECTSVRRKQYGRSTCAHAPILKAESLETATLIRVIPKKDKGKGEIVQLQKKFVGQDGIISETNEKVNAAAQEVVYSFVYQQDTYTFDREFLPSAHPIRCEELMWTRCS
jgi:cation-transporting ATPase 13A1